MHTYLLLRLEYRFLSDSVPNGFKFDHEGEDFWIPENDPNEYLSAYDVAMRYPDYSEYIQVVKEPRLAGSKESLEKYATERLYNFPEGYKIIAISLLED